MRARNRPGDLRVSAFAAWFVAIACSTTTEQARQPQHEAGVSRSDGSASGGKASLDGGKPSLDGSLSDAASRGGASSTDGGIADACKRSTPLTERDSGTGPTGGFERCENGVLHRPSKGECWSGIDTLDATVPPPPGVPDASPLRQCRANRDCTAAPHGYCSSAQPAYTGGAGGAPTESCRYGCVSDAECGAGSICLCGDPVGTCVTARCTTDADCPSGVLCQEVKIVPSCGPIRIEFRCGPQCKTDSDCASENLGFGTPTCVAGTCYPGSYCT